MADGRHATQSHFQQYAKRRHVCKTATEKFGKIGKITVCKKIALGECWEAPAEG